mgnify:CR=1 FL=1
MNKNINISLVYPPENNREDSEYDYFKDVSKVLLGIGLLFIYKECKTPPMVLGIPPTQIF